MGRLERAERFLYRGSLFLPLWIHHVAGRLTLAVLPCVFYRCLGPVGFVSPGVRDWARALPAVGGATVLRAAVDFDQPCRGRAGATIPGECPVLAAGTALQPGGCGHGRAPCAVAEHSFGSVAGVLAGHAVHAGQSVLGACLAVGFHRDCAVRGGHLDAAGHERRGVEPAVFHRCDDFECLSPGAASTTGPAQGGCDLNRRFATGLKIKHLYELYLLRTLKRLSSGHNLARTCHRNYVARCCSAWPDADVQSSDGFRAA
ncbi:hypothetical protein EMIT051CA3_50379 [Pseudomonas chlororaphis]